MKMRNKGKVHPSPCSYSSCSPDDAEASSLSVLKLLPAAILTIASVLSLQDRQVLAYMITRSIKSTINPSPPLFLEEKNKNSKKNPKKSSPNNTTTNYSHNSPSFDCECFECYTIFWFRWDSSPNRELIHQAIEAFEEQNLNLGDDKNNSKKGKNRKKEKMGRRGFEKRLDFSVSEAGNVSSMEAPENQETSLAVVVSPENEPELVLEVGESSQVVPESSTVVLVEEKEVVAAAEPLMETAAVVVSGGSSNHHKGFARKVLPDVWGLFNSRLWNLLSPNVY